MASAHRVKAQVGRKQDRRRRLSPEDLGRLAQALAEEDNPARATRRKARIASGFYAS